MSQATLSFCGEQARAHDPDRYLCALLAPPRAREALFALAAFNHELARIGLVTTEPMAGLVRLQWWRESLDGIAAGTPRAHPVAQALADAMQAHALPVALLAAMIDARERDLDAEPPADLEALEAYLAATAGGLAELGVHALDADGPAPSRAAREVGLAFGLVGLLRSIGYLARRRRLQLPLQLLEQEAVMAADVFAGRSSLGLARITADLAGRARAHLAAARARRAEVPRAALPALLPARLADAYLAQLRRAGHDPLAMPAQRPPTTPLRLLLARWAGRY